MFTFLQLSYIEDVKNWKIIAAILNGVLVRYLSKCACVLAYFYLLYYKVEFSCRYQLLVTVLISENTLNQLMKVLTIAKNVGFWNQRYSSPQTESCRPEGRTGGSWIVEIRKEGWAHSQACLISGGMKHETWNLWEESRKCWLFIMSFENVKCYYLI